MGEKIYRYNTKNYIISDGTIKALQEIPLLLSKEANSEAVSLDAWMQCARQQDQQLGIRRPWIPCLPIHLPQRSQTKNVFRLAQAIAQTARINFLPENHNQACWLKTLQYYQQARGLIIAQQLYPGVLASPLENILFDYLPQTSVENLRLQTNIDIACYRLLEKGESIIQDWATSQNISYPFTSPLKLFLEILTEQFQLLWQTGPLDSNVQWLDKHSQRANFSARIHLFSQNPWGETTSSNKSYSQPTSPRNLPYSEAETQYLQFLREIGWSGYWLLALREHIYCDSIAPLSKAYIKALKKAKPLFINELNWRNGQPYQSYSTSQTRPVEAIIDHHGYIHWHWHWHSA